MYLQHCPFDYPPPLCLSTVMNNLGLFQTQQGLIITHRLWINEAKLL